MQPLYPKKLRRLAPLVITVIIVGLGAIVFSFRPPVLVVTDVVFVSVYGKERIRRQRVGASLALFRRVKPVPIAEGASADMILVALGEAASRPFCVIFPASFAGSAKRYHQQFPEIPVVLMENRGFNADQGNIDSGGITIFKTDSETDLYRAGRMAAILGRGRNGDAVLFHDRYSQTGPGSAFFRGFIDGENTAKIRFLSQFFQFSGDSVPACVVLAGSGAEFLDRNTEVPVILFSWLDPSLTSREVAVIFDDSPWALTVPAVRMAVQQGGGQIPSKVLIFSAKIADNGILRKLKKASATKPEDG